MVLHIVITLLLTYSIMSSSFIKKFIRNFAMKPSSTPQLIEKIENKPPFLMLASIGNPENGYKGTRHSVGHMVLKEIASRHGFSTEIRLGKSSKFLANDYRPEMLLYESPSYMNTSGKNVKEAWTSVLNSAKLLQYTPVLVVLHDELDLALGKVKVKKQMSSHKGHNGLRSINSYIGGGFVGISVGISRPESRSPSEVADYVLSRFPSSEAEVIKGSVVEKVETIIQEMLEKEKYIYEVNENLRKKA